MNKKIIICLTSFFLITPLCAEEYSVIKHGKATVTQAFDTTGLLILGGGVALTFVALGLDSQTHDAWRNHQQISADVSKYGDFWGTGIPEALIIGGQIYYDQKNGIPALEGFVVGGVVTHSLKLITARRRPDSTTATAMPSGHTQAAFSLAASMTESYGWKTALPFWGMGVFTGLTRLADNAHCLSDVVAGATVGILFGRAGYHHHQNDIQIQPIVLFNQGQVNGLQMALKKQW